MGQFSLGWFKSSKQKELQELLLEEQRIKNELLRKELFTAAAPVYEPAKTNSTADAITT